MLHAQPALVPCRPGIMGNGARLLQGEVLAAGDVVHNAGCALDAALNQRRACGGLRSRAWNACEAAACAWHPQHGRPGCVPLLQCALHPGAADITMQCWNGMQALH